MTVSSELTAARETVGFIGLGRMGLGMARRLVASGHAVLAFDADAAALSAFGASGGHTAASVREVADRARIVFACLPTLDICANVALGKGGVVEGSTIEIYVETSTIGQAVAARIAAGLREARGIRMLDSPISGGQQGAADGTLTTVSAGDQSAFDEVQPLWRCMASHVVYAGAEPGLGQLYKVINNYIVMSAMAATCEAIAVGVRAGADEAKLVDVINYATGRNFATSVYFPSVVLPRKSVSSLHMAMKDVRLFADAAAGVGNSSEGACVVLKHWQAAADDGLSMVQWYERMLKGNASGDTDRSRGTVSTKAIHKDS